MSPEAIRKELVLEATLPADDLVVRSDRRALIQIVLNLVNRALQDMSKTNIREGTGLELHLSRKLAASDFSEVKSHSRVNAAKRGSSTFTLALVCGMTDGRARPNEQTLTMATILAVDDRPADREFLVALLGHQKYSLLEASDGAEALMQVRAHRPDLVITDILMPTMDGYEFVRQLRADPAIARTAVVFSTAHYHKNEAESLARSCGVGYILTKPCEPELILRTVEESLRTRLDLSRQPLPQAFCQQHPRVIADKLSQTADELRMSNHRLAALVDINLKVASERDHRQLLNNACAAARNLLGAKYAALAARPSGIESEVHFVASGMDAATIASYGPPGFA